VNVALLRQPTPTSTFVIASRRLAARQSSAGDPVFVQAHLDCFVAERLAMTGLPR
jgi:hypothetical protein